MERNALWLQLAGQRRRPRQRERPLHHSSLPSAPKRPVPTMDPPLIAGEGAAVPDRGRVET